MSKPRKVFTAKKIPDSWRRQEELESSWQSKHMLCARLSWSQLMARGEGSQGPSPCYPPANNRGEKVFRKTPVALQNTSVTPGHYVVYPRLDSDLFLRR